MLLARRISYAQFPEPDLEARFPHARSHPAHELRTPGEITAAIRATAAWQQEMATPLAVMDAAKRFTADGRRKPGPAPKFSYEETETMELYRRVVGAITTSEAFSRLARFESARDRRLLGFDWERFRARRGESWRRRQPGIPSDATMSKYRNELGEAYREEIWARFLARQRRDYVAENDIRVLFIDGTNIKIQGIAPMVDSNGQLRNNPARITVPTAGFQGRFRVTKGGHGFNAVVLVDEVGVPLADSLDRIQTDERRMAVQTIADWNENIRPSYATEQVRVLVADSGFTGEHVRRACRGAGMIESIHTVAHSDRDETAQRAREFNTARIEIEGNTAFELNRHRELVSVCGCGRASVERQAWLDRHGAAHTRLKGRCETCGENVTLKAGRYRVSRTTDRPTAALMTPLAKESDRDSSVGNPLTYNDPMARAYGRARFARNEGFNGMLASFYKLNGKPRRYRSRQQVRLEMNIVFSIMVSLAIEGRRAEAAERAAALPLTA